MARQPLPRFRFKASHAGLTLDGLGWHAQFRDGRFGTDDKRTAIGVMTRGEQHPEYGIELVRGAEKPDPTTPPPPAETEDGQG